MKDLSCPPGGYVKTVVSQVMFLEPLLGAGFRKMMLRDARNIFALRLSHSDSKREVSSESPLTGNQSSWVHFLPSQQPAM